jgi:hypothetical protein
MNVYPEDCEPLLDSDCDGIPDDGASGDLPCTTGQTASCDDNCPHTPNPGQEDRGSIAPGLLPDGIGDECQCGDVDADGSVTLADAVVISHSLLSPPRATMARSDLCDVGGSVGCSLEDFWIVLRSILEPQTTVVQQQCEPTWH